MVKEELQEEIEELKQIKKSLQMDIIELDDKILFQDFGVYQPQYNFATLDEYKDKLDEIREEQKSMINREVQEKFEEHLGLVFRQNQNRQNHQRNFQKYRSNHQSHQQMVHLYQNLRSLIHLHQNRFLHLNYLNFLNYLN